MSLTTPVLFIVYNRLETTKKVFSRIREAKPTRIYIAADGPKGTVDLKKVEKVREYILENIDWSTEIRTLFQKDNLGAKYAVFEALEWFFSLESRGIILEDDCLPGNGFFSYCEELLDRYESDKQIGMISGRNELGTYENEKEGDYFLSTRGFCWGWATWRDRFEMLDIDIAQKVTLNNILVLYKNASSFLEFVFRMKNIKQLRVDNLDAWDYQWSICLLLNSMYAIVPKKNMIKNIGFGEGATHAFNNDVDNVDHFEGMGSIIHPNKLSSIKEYTHQTVLKHTGGLLRALVPRFLVKTVRYFK